jgi:RNA polymerase sigma-70 factor (ECF subfamily)
MEGMSRSVPTVLPAPARAALDVAEVYEAEADFVWRCLHRLGVHERDLPDLMQEVFVIVHRQRARYDHARPLRAWLFGIAAGLARNYRRRAFRRFESLSGASPEARDTADPEQALDAQRRRQRGERVLAELDPEQRAVFVMFEVEAMSGKAIAELLDVPLGTVHSRLHAARKALLAVLEEVES